MALSISPLPGNTLINWSFDAPRMARSWGSRTLYYMMIVYGVDDSPINFSVDIEVGNVYLLHEIKCYLHIVFRNQLKSYRV